MCGFYLMKKYTFAAGRLFYAGVAFVISVFGLTISVLKGM
ncbi:hypothetical protein MYA98_05880 [Salmonella sp. WGH-01]|nr:hypothetical protein MYA98_05880 [Salmonella sp. WGH-01]